MLSRRVEGNFSSGSLDIIGARGKTSDFEMSDL
jgi:hypothetical protein